MNNKRRLIYPLLSAKHTTTFRYNALRTLLDQAVSQYAIFWSTHAAPVQCRHANEIPNRSERTETDQILGPDTSKCALINLIFLRSRVSSSPLRRSLILNLRLLQVLCHIGLGVLLLLLLRAGVRAAVDTLVRLGGFARFVCSALVGGCGVGLKFVNFGLGFRDVLDIVLAFNKRGKRLVSSWSGMG